MPEPTPTNTITPPDITGVINQQFFIEPLGGPQGPRSYLEAFPETLYNRSLESNLVALLYALLGPSGIGGLRQNYLRARLAIEENGLQTTELDELYANPFSFARLASESYEENTEGLLTNEQWAKIVESDRSYQNRAINYLKAVQAGGTLLGITLAATSGLNRTVEVIENYRALFDAYSDDPLELEKLGATDSTEEIILLPRQELPRNAVQVISILGTPMTGSFKLAFPIGEGETSENYDNENTSTSALPYNATFNEVRVALEALPRVGPNLAVRGGPLPGNPIEVEFIGTLADRPVPPVLITANSLTGLEEGVIDVQIEQTQAGVAADGTVATIPPEDWYYAQFAVDNIKPMTTIVSTGKSPGITKRQIPTTTAADSEFTEVLRFVTGRNAVQWPPVDATHWIEAGKEKELPKLKNGETSYYEGFHDIWNATAYTGAALENPDYGSSNWLEVLPKYADEHEGSFSPEQAALFPFLGKFNAALNPTAYLLPLSATYAPVNPPEALTFGGPNMIEGGYNTEYVELVEEEEKQHGLAPAAFGKVFLRPTLRDRTASQQTPYWASKELSVGTDYLEIDLGSVEAVNYLVFEASNKPYNIAVAYDVLDAYPERRFIPVTYVASELAVSHRSIGHATQRPNPWNTVEINFTNTLNMMIYTRVIRIEFERRVGEGSPFSLTNGTNLPYSIEVRNLRLGRVISGYVEPRAVEEPVEEVIVTPRTAPTFPETNIYPSPELYPNG